VGGRKTGRKSGGEKERNFGTSCGHGRKEMVKFLDARLIYIYIYIWSDWRKLYFGPSKSFYLQSDPNNSF